MSRKITDQRLLSAPVAQVIFLDTRPVEVVAALLDAITKSRMAGRAVEEKEHGSSAEMRTQVSAAPYESEIPIAHRSEIQDASQKVLPGGWGDYFTAPISHDGGFLLTEWPFLKEFEGWRLAVSPNLIPIHESFTSFGTNGFQIANDVYGKVILKKMTRVKNFRQTLLRLLLSDIREGNTSERLGEAYNAFTNLGIDAADDQFLRDLQGAEAAPAVGSRAPKFGIVLVNVEKNQQLVIRFQRNTEKRQQVVMKMHLQSYGDDATPIMARRPARDLKPKGILGRFSDGNSRGPQAVWPLVNPEYIREYRSVVELIKYGIETRRNRTLLMLGASVVEAEKAVKSAQKVWEEAKQRESQAREHFQAMQARESDAQREYSQGEEQLDEKIDRAERLKNEFRDGEPLTDAERTRIDGHYFALQEGLDRQQQREDVLNNARSQAIAARRFLLDRQRDTLVALSTLIPAQEFLKQYRVRAQSVSSHAHPVEPVMVRMGLPGLVEKLPAIEDYLSAYGGTRLPGEALETPYVIPGVHHWDPSDVDDDRIPDEREIGEQGL